MKMVINFMSKVCEYSDKHCVNLTKFNSRKLTSEEWSGIVKIKSLKRCSNENDKNNNKKKEEYCRRWAVTRSRCKMNRGTGRANHCDRRLHSMFELESIGICRVIVFLIFSKKNMRCMETLIFISHFWLWWLSSVNIESQMYFFHLASFFSTFLCWRTIVSCIHSIFMK